MVGRLRKEKDVLKLIPLAIAGLMLGCSVAPTAPAPEHNADSLYAPMETLYK